MVRRAALIVLAAALGCTSRSQTSTQSSAPEPLADADADDPDDPADPAEKAPRKGPRRPSPAVLQALAELERNPELHLLVVGPRAEPVRKAMLRAGRGRIDDDRIRVDDGEAAGSRGVEFRFYVPEPEVPGAAVHAIHSYVPQ